MPTVNSLSIIPYTSLYTNNVDSVTTASTTVREGRTSIVLDFNGGQGLFYRDFETAFSWPLSSDTILYTYQPSLLELPENTYNRTTDWIEIGGRNGLVQGILIEADSFNVPKTFQLQDSDTLALHPLNETPATFNLQSVKAFSCTTPFIAHSIRIITTDNIPWRVWRTEPIFVPYPEKAQNWTTEITSLTGFGFQHLFYLDVEYRSNSDITITFTCDTGNGSYAPQSFTLPSSGDTQTKSRTLMTPNKWKLLGVSAISNAPFYLFVEGMEGYVRNWGIPGPYRIEKFFGGPSSPGAQV